MIYLYNVDQKKKSRVENLILIYYNTSYVPSVSY